MRTRVLPIRHSLCWFLFGLSRHTVTCVAYLHPPSRVLLFFQDVEQQKKGCGLRHFRRRRFVAADMVTSFFGLSQPCRCVCICIRMYVRMRVLILILSLWSYCSSGVLVGTPPSRFAHSRVLSLCGPLCALEGDREVTCANTYHNRNNGGVCMRVFRPVYVRGRGHVHASGCIRCRPTRTVRHPSP